MQMCFVAYRHDKEIFVLSTYTTQSIPQLTDETF